MRPLPERETTERPPRANLSLPRDIIIAPKRAFAKISATSEWLPAYAIIFVVSMIATALLAPALLHIARVTPPPAGETAPRTPAQVADAARSMLATYAVAQAAISLLLIFLTSSALGLIARFKGQTPPPFLYVSLAANCMIPSALGGLLNAVLIRLHDPASFKNFGALLVAVPTSLAVFAAPGNEREVSFLSRFDLFDIWSYVLLAFGFATLAPVKFNTALVIAFALDFVFAIML